VQCHGDRRFVIAFTEDKRTGIEKRPQAGFPVRKLLGRQRKDPFCSRVQDFLALSLDATETGSAVLTRRVLLDLPLGRARFSSFEGGIGIADLLQAEFTNLRRAMWRGQRTIRYEKEHKRVHGPYDFQDKFLLLAYDVG
jgi:hypothetical protein